MLQTLASMPHMSFDGVNDWHAQAAVDCNDASLVLVGKAAGAYDASLLFVTELGNKLLAGVTSAE